jgi:hypothetical protein
MPSQPQSFESFQTLLAEQTVQWSQVCRAIEAFHPAQSLAVAPELLSAFDAACSVQPSATAAAALPMGLRG